MLGFFVIIISIALGIFVGMVINIPLEMSNIIGAMIAACIYSVINGVNLKLKDEFRVKYFLVTFSGNLLFAFLLSFLGEKIGISLYFAVIIVYIARSMSIISSIYERTMKKIKDRVNKE